MERILKRIAESKWQSRVLKLLSYLSALAGIAAYGALLYLAYKSSINELAFLLVAAGVPFVLVTLFRHLVNAPRPYEMYDFYQTPPKNKCGKSFPSRHVFSGFVIATLAFAYSLPLALVMLGFAVILAVSRVLLGIHFIRDVVCGALVGVVSGVIGIVIFNLI